MTASAATILGGGNYVAMDNMRQIGKSKGYKSQVLTISGVECWIYQDFAEKDGAAKLQGIKDGVKRVVELGYSFPDGITFYTSSRDDFQSIAFHRAHGGNRKAVVQLGNSSVNTAGMVGKKGIADQVATASQSTYCAAVVVHELGHNLHERANEGFFWDGPVAGGLPPIDLALQVSQYGASNKLEFVAEVFTGTAYGLKYSGTIMQTYADYHGPTAG